MSDKIHIQQVSSFGAGDWRALRSNGDLLFDIRLRICSRFTVALLRAQPRGDVVRYGTFHFETWITPPSSQCSWASWRSWLLNQRSIASSIRRSKPPVRSHASSIIRSVGVGRRCRALARHRAAARWRNVPPIDQRR